MSREFIVLLGANQYLRERALAGARQCTQAEVWIADPLAVLNKNRYFDGSLPASPYDAKSIIEQVENMNNMKLLSVIPLNDWVLETANKVNAHFGLPALSEQTVVRARNKFAMKLMFSEHHIPIADYFLLSNDDELPAALAHVGLPAIIKPYDFGGSGGVFVANTHEEAVKYLGESRELISMHKDAFKIKGDKYLIEEYINSVDEVSVEVICFRGKYKTVTVTEKYLSPEPWFSELGHLVPSFRHKDEELRSLAEKSCAALGIEFGMAHVEIKIRDGQFYVIEIAARPGGDGIMDQVETAFGINPYALHIGAYLGQDTTETHIPEPSGTAAIAFLKAKEGVITKINRAEDLEYDKNLFSLKITTEVGKKSEPPKNWSTREGVAEFYWYGYFEDKKTLLPLDKARAISAKLFEVE
ncbi:ATP-grasp domain-containing protein [Stenoxybacter acetivorans]|uniref:ATP-grasp domain-containing protein n=1 Tax=Stenoxybacter acetivorans TaxID=422441 RepID=UPI0005618062|nr:ATP-grasp domain-containing protein [Stenoxybacter acetivorans]